MQMPMQMLCKASLEHSVVATRTEHQESTQHRHPRGDQVGLLDHLVAVENVTPVKIFMFTALAPEDIQSVHFLRRISGGLWSYYGLARTGVGLRSLKLNDARIRSGQPGENSLR